MSLLYSIILSLSIAHIIRNRIKTSLKKVLSIFFLRRGECSEEIHHLRESSIVIII